MLFNRELAANLEVCRNCGHHFRLAPAERFRILFDGGAFDLAPTPRVGGRSAALSATASGTPTVKEAQAVGGAGSDAIAVAHGRIGDIPAVIAAFDFAFMGGSMGVAVGEAFVAAARLGRRPRGGADPGAVVGRRAHAGGHSCR